MAVLPQSEPFMGNSPLDEPTADANPNNLDHSGSDTEGMPGLLVNYPPGAEILTPAGSSVIYTLPNRPNEVIKVPLPLPEYALAHEIERRIYRRLGKHKNLVGVVEMNEYGIYLERAEHGCFRLYFKDGGTATLHERLQWCRDLARVVGHVHENNVRHADLSGRNLLLDSARNLLLCDFAGSSIDDEPALIVAERGYRHPDEKEHNLPTIRSELHSLGSTLYEVVMGTPPFDGLAEHEIDKLVIAGSYPDLKNIPLGGVIETCWRGGFDSAALVADEISKLIPARDCERGA